MVYDYMARMKRVQVWLRRTIERVKVCTYLHTYARDLFGAGLLVMWCGLRVDYCLEQIND
jgi:hypothetical protein